MRVETAKKWQKRVRRWKRSGKTAEEFAEGEGVSPRSLTWWSWRLRKAEREGKAPFGQVDFASAVDEEASKGDGQPDRSGLQVDADGTLLRFLPVRLRQEVIPSAVSNPASAPLEIHLANGRVVLARPGVDPDWLSEMLAVIERPGAWSGGC
jgi:transposase